MNSAFPCHDISLLSKLILHCYTFSNAVCCSSMQGHIHETYIKNKISQFCLLFDVQKSKKIDLSNLEEGTIHYSLVGLHFWKYFRIIVHIDEENKKYFCDFSTSSAPQLFDE